MAQRIIRQLLAVRGLKVECPNCTDEFAVKRARLFSMYGTYPPAVAKLIRQRLQDAQERRIDLIARKRLFAESKKRRPQKITLSAQASHFGQIGEQILPAFVTFPYPRRECRILFKPIDYVVFDNLSDNGRINAIKLVDVKTGNGRLDQRQKKIRDRIAEGKVRHKVIG